MRIGVLFTAQPLLCFLQQFSKLLYIPVVVKVILWSKKRISQTKNKRFFTGPPRTLNMLMCYLWGCDIMQHLPNILLAELFLQENNKCFNMHLLNRIWFLLEYFLIAAILNLTYDLFLPAFLCGQFCLSWEDFWL